MSAVSAESAEFAVSAVVENLVEVHASEARVHIVLKWQSGQPSQAGTGHRVPFPLLPEFSK